MPSTFQLSSPTTANSAEWLLLYGKSLRKVGKNLVLSLPVPTGRETLGYNEEMVILWFLNQTNHLQEAAEVLRELSLQVAFLMDDNSGLPLTVRLSTNFSKRDKLLYEVIPEPAIYHLMTN